MRRIPLSPYTIPRDLIQGGFQAQRPQRRVGFGPLPHQYLRRLPLLPVLPVVCNEGTAAFVSVLVAAALTDFQMLARLETRIAILLKMCGRSLMLTTTSPKGVVSFASKAFFF